MLDEQDRHPLRGERAQQLGEGLGLAVAQTRGRLVEQQQARARGERAAQLAEAGQPGRKRVGPFVGDVAQPDAIEDGVGVVGAGPTEVVRPSTPDLGRDENVLACAERPEHLELLERARDAEAGALGAASRG